ncbi:hypothetical protein BLNAU_22742 [Blattamonas nauphoetae]|uniref:Uncharacterized protein n=1 Tax=Blattamonas nauphoetae TaxID=2049346 RepID=A0ABQ9WWE4_9EUKA|nr:hypothetical protein BLNAU_22742 [Blattamonas nauphoetae]
MLAPNKDKVNTTGFVSAIITTAFTAVVFVYYIIRRMCRTTSQKDHLDLRVAKIGSAPILNRPHIATSPSALPIGNDCVLAHHQDNIHSTFLVGIVLHFCDKAKTDRGIVIDA